MAQAYEIALQVNRDSTQAEVLQAYRQVAKRAHPDKGGRKRDFQRLQSSKEAWDAARKAQPGPGRPSPAAAASTGAIVVSGLWSEKGQGGHRVRSGAVLLTYSGVWSVGLWKRFGSFVRKHVDQWGVLRWCSTLERSDAGHLHVHLSLQFRQSIDRPSKSFSWAGRMPNASANDYLGQGLNTNPRYYQQSVDRGSFYVFADKEGTQQDAAGQLCVDGNYCPSWAKSRCASRYHAMGQWPLALWQQHKLAHATYEEYVFLCRDNVVARKRNLDAVRQREEEAAEAIERTATAKRVRAITLEGFTEVPAVTAWQALFAQEVDRYPILVLLAPSRSRKTEYAKSLFKAPLELKIGWLEHFPDGMRRFARQKHDAIILDDCRDFAFLVRHQEKLQGKSDVLVEFGSTPGGQLSYTKWLHRVPIVVTANYTTKHRELLDDDDFLGHPDNRTLVEQAQRFD